MGSGAKCMSNELDSAWWHNRTRRLVSSPTTQVCCSFAYWTAVFTMSKSASCVALMQVWPLALSADDRLYTIYYHSCCYGLAVGKVLPTSDVHIISWPCFNAWLALFTGSVDTIAAFLCQTICISRSPRLITYNALQAGRCLKSSEQQCSSQIRFAACICYQYFVPLILPFSHMTTENNII